MQWNGLTVGLPKLLETPALLEQWAVVGTMAELPVGKGVGELAVVVVVSDVVSNVGTGAHVGCSANSSCC